MSGRVALGKLSPVEGLQFADCERIVSSAAPEPPKRKRRDVWVPLKKQAPYAAVISMIVVFLIFISTVQIPVPVEQEPTEDYYIDKDGHVIQKTEKTQGPAPAPSLGYASLRAPTGWSDDLNISQNSSSDSRSSIAVNEDTLHVVYSNSYVNIELMYVRSLDGGDTWSEPKKLTNGAGVWAVPPSIQVVGDKIHVIWQDTRVGDEIYYINSSDAGDTWSSERQISDSDAAWSQWPTLAVNGLNVHVAWGDYRHDGESCGGSNCDYEIYYVRSTDSGATWGSNTRLTTAAGESLNPSIGVNGTNVHLTFDDNRASGTGSHELWYMNSTNNGDSWDTERMITYSPGLMSAGSKIAIDGDNIHAVYQNLTGVVFNIFYLNSTDGGISWSESRPLTVSMGAYSAESPSIAVDGSNVSIAWNDNQNGNFEIYFRNSTDGGKTFNPELRLTTSSGNSYWPDLTPGSLHLVFFSNRGGNYEVFYKRSPANDPVPIPEFGEIFLPIVSIIAIGFIIRWKRKRVVRK